MPSNPVAPVRRRAFPDYLSTPSAPVTLSLLLALGLAPDPASAQSYPAEPVRLIVTGVLGGSDDFHVRVVDVGYADLGAPDIADTLDREHTHPNLRGVRQQLHWHRNPLYRFAPRPDVMNDAAFRRGMKAVAERGLLFELQVFASQMGDAARLAQDFPEVTLVLLHAGMAEDRGPVGWKRRQDGMRLLAARPNVCVKLSGLGTFTRSCSVELWQPIIEETLGFFGPARCMFGSNFPIEKLWTSYGEIVSVTKACLKGLSAAERRAVLHDNAERVYRL